MSSANSAKPTQKLFTLEEANATLPLVSVIVRDLAQLAQSIQERRERLIMLKGDKRRRKDDIYADELAQIEQEVDRDIAQLQEYVEELNTLGIELKGALDGLIDFPAEMEGRIVYLCWKLGEAEVSHWHELDAGFAGRRSLTADSLLGHDPGTDR